MTIRLQQQDSASSQLRVSVACFRWNGESLETATTDGLLLPSAVPGVCETLDETADRIIESNFEVSAAYIEQLYTFDHVDDEDRETNVTYIALFPPDAQSTFQWRESGAMPALAEPARQILDYAYIRLRAKLEYTHIAFYLMPPTFTLAALQLAYESIIGVPLDKRNFRRRMSTSGMLEPTGEKRREGPHRPAALYRFSGQADRSSYLTPSSASASWQEPDS